MADAPLLRSILLALSVGLISACAAPPSRAPGQATEEAGNPVVFTPENSKPDRSIGPAVTARAAQVILVRPGVQYRTDITREQREDLRVAFPPEPKKKRPKSRPVDPDETDQVFESRRGRATQSTIESIDTPTNISNTGSLFIPADAHGAAGPNHVVAVTNTSIEIFQKNGSLDLSTSLRNFFSAVSPTTFTFDPKVLYDQYEDRWLIVTLERSDLPNTSSVLLAVSDSSDPNASWTQIRIDSSIDINGNDHWFDYPGFAVDDEAVYITGNMFRYFDGTAGQGSFGGIRLFVIDKGTAGGFYDGGPASASLIDPAGGGAFAFGHQPAHTYGAVPAGLGALLVGYSGLSSGATGNDFYQIISVTDPLGAPTVSSTTLNAGDFDNAFAPFPDAPQAGSATTGGNIPIETNDRRTLNAVWRDDGLWLTHSFLPGSGPDAGQVTAGWARLDTSTPGSFSLDQFGFAGGEDIATGAFTFFPSLAVNDDGGMMLGFSASAPSIHPGAYYSYRTPTDPSGSLRDGITIRAGLDYYQRTFAGSDNRWGDYSSAALDPDGRCFWIYNKYAINRGNSTGTNDDGRWGTAFAHFCNDAPVANGDAAEVDQGQTISILTTGQTSVLANDDDPDASDTLVVTTTPVSGPDHASAFSIADDGSFSYTHDGTTTVSDTVVYEVCDDGSPIACDTATLQITIGSNVNSAPEAVDDALTVAEGGTATLLDSGNASVLDNDSDPESDNLAVNGPASPAPDHASGFTLNPDGTFSYTHDGSESLSDAFGYQVCDDGTPSECATATVTIAITEVNDPPLAIDDVLADVAEDSGTVILPASTLTTNDSPGPGEVSQALTVTAVGNAAGGTVTLNGSNIEFTTAADYNGPAGFDYEVTDNGTTDGSPDPLSAVAVATFDITEINDPPVATGDTLGDSAEDGGLRIIPATALLANDNPGPGENAQTLSVTAVSTPIGGTIALNGTNVEFSPAADYNGPAGFSYTITDNGTTNGAPDPRAATTAVDFQITPVDDPPVAVADAFQTDIDQLLNGDVSLNDSDIDSPSLSYSESTPPASGSLTLNPDGSFTFLPGPGFFGEVNFVYSVSDGTSSDTATVSITVLDLVFQDGFESEP